MHEMVSWDCVGESVSYKGAWACAICRYTPTLVRQIHHEIGSLKSMFSAMMEDISTSVRQTKDELASLKVINADLLKQLAEKDQQLKLHSEQYDKLNMEHIKLLSRDLDGSQKRKSNKKTLLIGSSMIRGIGSKDTSVLQIKPFSSASVGDITEELEKDTSQYNEVIIVTDGNDCEIDHNSTTEISAAVNSLLLKAKKKAPSVKIASVLPRPKKTSNAT